jgi:prepilin-type processing-associated H-X9-DG protein
VQNLEGCCNVHFTVKIPLKTSIRTVLIISLLVLLSLPPMTAPAHAQPPEQAVEPQLKVPELWQPDPKEPIYMAAMTFNRQDKENLNWRAERVIGKPIPGEALPLVAEELNRLRGGYNITVDDIQVTLQGEQATAVVELTLHNRWVGVHQTEKVLLKRSDKEPGSPWWIIPDNPIMIFADDQAGLIQRLATCLAYPQIFIRESRKRAAVKNIAAIHLGLQQFLQDFEGVYAFEAPDFRAAIMPYLGSDTVFTAPNDPPGTVSYEFNPNLARVEAPKLNAAKVVILYEVKEGRMSFAYDGKAIVGFADGHTEFVTPEQAAQLRWKP